MKSHQQLGQELELFITHEYSPGCPIFLPDGMRIYNGLIKMLRDEYEKRGYQEVMTPDVYKSMLWEISGHWENYKDNMFLIKTKEEKAQYAQKSMNCPAHCLIFKSRPRYESELPLRLAEFGTCHRNELAGSLRGLFRVRKFKQDDAHIFCKMDQIEKETRDCLNFVESVYSKFGFDFDLELSTRPEKYIGDLDTWNRAEKIFEKILSESSYSWSINAGDGAFYGPKIDIHIRDAFARSHQCATIQLDFNSPSGERFNLKYVDDDNNFHTPVMIHRAIFGSLERFIGVLLEHTQGRLPLWLSPRQFIVLPLREEFKDVAQEVYNELKLPHMFIDIDLNTYTHIKTRIKKYETKKYYYIIVIGQKEKDTQVLSVRHQRKTYNKTITELHEELISHGKPPHEEM